MQICGNWILQLKGRLEVTQRKFMNLFSQEFKLGVDLCCYSQLFSFATSNNGVRHWKQRRRKQHRKITSPQFTKTYFIFFIQHRQLHKQDMLSDFCVFGFFLVFVLLICCLSLGRGGNRLNIQHKSRKKALFFMFLHPDFSRFYSINWSLR